jgi:5-methylcytosine-specific restriction endonuclease McrA
MAMNLHHDIIGINIQRVAPAMLDTSGSVVKPVRRSGMFILTDKKQCSKCKKWKEKSEFGKYKNGLRAQCKKCHIENNRDYSLRNPKKVKETQHSWYLLNARKVIDRVRRKYFENPDVVKDRVRKWNNAHPGKQQERAQKWYLRNKESIKKKSVIWGKLHPEKKLEIQRFRRSQAKKSSGKITNDEWELLKKKYNYACLKCKKREPEIKLTLDHIMPLKLGGLHTIDNAQPLCPSCNASKGAKHIDYR